MSALEIVGTLLGAVLHLSDISHTVDITYKTFLRRVRRHGIGTYILLHSTHAFSLLDRIERHVLTAEPEKVKDFMDSLSSSFNMIGVAGAIIATVATTALGLDSLENTHWTAEAMFIMSLVTGALSVFFSCAVHPAINGLDHPESIRDWLSQPSQILLTNDDQSVMTDYVRTKVLTQGSNYMGSEEFWTDIQDLLSTQPCKRTSRNASAHAALMLVAPRQLLTASLNALLVGMGIYLGFVWSAQLVPSYGSSGSLAILIIYLCTVFVGLFSFYVPQTMKEVEIQSMDRFRGQAARAHLQTSNDANSWTNVHVHNQPMQRTVESANMQHSEEPDAAMKELPKSIVQEGHSQYVSSISKGTQGVVQIVPAIEKSLNNYLMEESNIRTALEEFIAAQQHSAKAAQKLMSSLSKPS